MFSAVHTLILRADILLEANLAKVLAAPLLTLLEANHANLASLERHCGVIVASLERHWSATVAPLERHCSATDPSLERLWSVTGAPL